MDPDIDNNEWLGVKNDPVEESQNVGNIVQSWQWREIGIDPVRGRSNKSTLENVAEDILVQKDLKIRSCDLPGYPRSTFLMVFSPDGTKVASTHGNHNVYVSELASGKHVRILKGHPRTPWCVAFHPSHPQLIGSGCLGGQVRVWDISSGGSEVWNVRNETVIASIAFHPREQLLVIATYNELYFWDWSKPAPFTRVQTNNSYEKVRYVAFDSLGYKLITGISLTLNTAGFGSIFQQNTTGGQANQTPRREEPEEGQERSQENPGNAQDMIVNSYQNLVQRYDSLVRNYQRLFMVRHRLSNTPPPPNTIDRGTDPMETDASPSTSGWLRRPRASTSGQSDDGNQGPSATRRPRTTDGTDSGEGDANSSRLLNLDALSFDTPSRNQELPQEHSVFGSSPSAFQPLPERRLFRTVDQNERTSRLLPNPFSASTTNRPNTASDTNNAQQSDNSNANSSRTSIFTSTRPATTFAREFLQRRRNSSAYQNGSRNLNSLFSDDMPSSSSRRPGTNPTSPENTPSTSSASSPRPAMTNSSTQMSPNMSGASLDAQTINESLDLIRDILRDSGTRLLNLITSMSISTLANVERRGMRRAGSSRTQSNDSGGAGTSRAGRPRVFGSSINTDILSSSSDSDSDSALEVHILRTMNSTFNEETNDGSGPSTSRTANPTDRLEFELNDESSNERTLREGGVNVSFNDRFRVRTQSTSGTADTSSTNRTEDNNPIDRLDDTSATRTVSNTTTPDNQSHPLGRSDNTSANTGTENEPRQPRSYFRDNLFMNGNVISSEEAFRKVKAGVCALLKHTFRLSNLWIQGNRTTMRELRCMWENLRRRILALHRETGRNDLPSYYTRSLLERCMMLTEMSGMARTNRSRNPPRTETNERTESRDNTESNAATNVETGQPNTATTSDRPSSRPMPRSSVTLNPTFLARRRLQSSYRWRPEDELRRRARNPPNRLSLRYSNRNRGDLSRTSEITATRHEIRMRAMQVLSVMFNMMMMCLEERGLSQLIITMLRTLKKALALTCLMLMTNRNARRAGNNPAAGSSRMESLNVVRIQNIDHSDPVNVDGPDDPASPRPNLENSSPNTGNENKSTETDKPSTSQEKAPTVDNEENSPPLRSNSSTQRWSNRVAVQIAAANRNNSLTARNRRELYLESKRIKALHRTNPTAHPLIRKRALPPVTTHKIPALRSLPSKVRRINTPRKTETRNDDQIAGPSSASNPPNDNANSDSPRDEIFNEFEQRVSLIRFAHLHAQRLRNVARNRYRRLQTIRLYTPSSVREMFDLNTNNPDNAPGSLSPLHNGPELGNRRSFVTFRANRSSDEPGHFHTVLNNVAMPLMQVNDIPAAENQASQPQRLPRIHEYLQPIILAQNAMLVDEDGPPPPRDAPGGAGGVGGGGGARGDRGEGEAGAGMEHVARRFNSGMAGLLDSGIISETLPAASHRVQAWDFTKGDAPNIADSTKNVVVQRCRIHNDASIDISKDGRLLVAILPVPRMRNTSHWLGVYSLEWGRLGQCLHTAMLEQSAVSVALSPTARYLAVGLGSRRFTTTPHPRNNIFALLYKLEPVEKSSRSGLSPIKELEQNWEPGFTSLNCLRWAPQPGQGLVYANNTGQLIIMS